MRITVDGNYDGGWFVERATDQLYSYSEGQSFLVTCKNDRGLLTAITNQIKTARKYLKICSFIIDNEQIFNSLMNRLLGGEIAIFILTAVNEKDIKSDLLNEEDSERISQSKHFDYINQLVNNGAHVRASSSAHAKFIISDGETALIMSANFTEPSLNNNAKGLNPNDESGILIQSAIEMQPLERLFDAVFNYGTEFTKFVDMREGSQLINQKNIDIQLSDLPHKTGPVIWSYGSFHRLIYDEIIKAVATAQRTIKLSTYSIVELQLLPVFFFLLQ